MNIVDVAFYYFLRFSCCFDAGSVHQACIYYWLSGCKFVCFWFCCSLSHRFCLARMVTKPNAVSLHISLHKALRAISISFPRLPVLLHHRDSSVVLDRYRHELVHRVTDVLMFQALIQIAVVRWDVLLKCLKPSALCCFPLCLPAFA